MGCLRLEILFGDALVEPDRTGQVFLVWVTLGYAAHQPEGAEGVKSQAAVFPKDLGAFGAGDLGDGIRVALLFCPAGIKKEHRLSLGQAGSRQMQDAFVELGIVNAGGEAHPLIAAQVGIRGGCGVDQVYAVKGLRKGIHKLFRVAVMLGIIDDGCFHMQFSLICGSIKIILYKKTAGKYAESVYLVSSTVLEGPMRKDMTAEEYLQQILSDGMRDDCPVGRTLELLSGKWRTRIIYELCKKPSWRFCELKKAVPRITNTMLTTVLRDLERLGIVGREQFNEIPPHVEYSLTEQGRALLPVFFELARWGEAYLRE